MVSPDGTRLVVRRGSREALVDLTAPLPIAELEYLPEPTEGGSGFHSSWSPGGNRLAMVTLDLESSAWAGRRTPGRMR